MITAKMCIMQVKSGKISANAGVVPESFMYEAQWQIVDAALPPSEKTTQTRCTARPKLAVEIIAADGKRQLLASSSSARSQLKSITELAPQTTIQMTLIGQGVRSGRKFNISGIQDPFPAMTAPSIATEALQALQHFTASKGNTSASLPKCVSLTTRGAAPPTGHSIARYATQTLRDYVMRYIIDVNIDVVLCQENACMHMTPCH